MKPAFKKRVDAFVELGKQLQNTVVASSSDSLSPAGKDLFHDITESQNKNPWFTSENVKKAIMGLSAMLEDKKMREWLKDYPIQEPKNPAKIAVVMAGNLPVVGFHDFMCVLLTGNNFLGKLSKQDKDLPVKIAALLTEIEPGFSSLLEFTEDKISDFDAVIATGSNNTSRYFEYYFGKYPHIIRRNRNSIAILDGNETPGELEALSDDIFMFYGMGCRSVSMVFVPVGYDLELLLKSFSKWEFLKDHHKFHNNYEYQKAVLLVNQIHHFDTGYSIVKEGDQLASPLSVLHYKTYKDICDVKKYTEEEEKNIQCIVVRQGLTHIFNQSVKLGRTQNPGPDDFADGVDTIDFLLRLGS